MIRSIQPILSRDDHHAASDLTGAEIAAEEAGIAAATAADVAEIAADEADSADEIAATDRRTAAVSMRKYRNSPTLPRQ